MGLRKPEKCEGCPHYKGISAVADYNFCKKLNVSFSGNEPKSFLNCEKKERNVVSNNYPEFMSKHLNEPVKCPYCQEGHALVEGKTNDAGIAILYTNRLLAYGYDIHGPGSNGLSVKIEYCPMCGRKL